MYTESRVFRSGNSFSREGKNMNWKNFLQGVAVGAIGSWFLLVTVGGFMMGSTGEKMAKDAAIAAAKAVYIELLTPQCVATAMAAGNEATLAEVKAATAYSRRGLVEKTNWIPEGLDSSAKRAVAEACASELG